MVKIPEIVELEVYEETVPLVRERPFNALLIKEVMRYNALLHIIRSNLDVTYAAMEGLLHHSDETDQTFECL